MRKNTPKRLLKSETGRKAARIYETKGNFINSKRQDDITL